MHGSQWQRSASRALRKRVAVVIVRVQACGVPVDVGLGGWAKMQQSQGTPAVENADSLYEVRRPHGPHI